MDVIKRNNVVVAGRGRRPMMFAHGFGCDQAMWRFVAPAFEDEWRTILFDLVGAGGSDLAAYDRDKYAHLDGHAEDVIEICEALHLEGVVFVGHSVSAMIGALAAARRPGLFSALVMVGPSPRYINDEGYIGGFSGEQIEELIEFLDSNYLGWSSAMAPAIMGNAERPELGQELTNSFCQTDPEIAKHFARVTFLSDNRSDLARIDAPTLVLQCADDIIAPVEVGDYVHQAIKGSTLVRMRASGHCPNLSAPEETISAIRQFLALYAAGP